MIAYPICPGIKVSRVKAYVHVEHGEKASSKTLWSAEGANSEEVAQGLFVVGAPDSFRHEERPLSDKLPGGFYVSVKEIKRDGYRESSRGDWIDQSVRPSSPLKPGEYMTSEGEVVSRKWVNDQMKCKSAA
ncbi:hypothetical protein [Streptomyces sp. NPDC088726]|uniref:hypothetical protein n=1 Tax=Streptomyces sp. NPDC088726 TaxID=3365874 RepID=UPI00380D4882